MHSAATDAIAPATTVGPVALTVADLGRSIAFYEHVIGLRLRERSGSTASLGTTGAALLVLTEEPGARPVSGHTGLFHFALLLPMRADLARWLAHAAAAQAPITGMSDHFVSEAIYLRDPDGHGIEVYADRPRAQWRWNGDGLVMGTVPLDTAALLATLGSSPVDELYEGMPDATRMGHVHLHVADLGATEQFYRAILGFDVTVSIPGQATFLSAGGYHHHLAGNVWAGRGATPPPPGSAALRSATILLPDAAERDRAAGRVADAGQEPQPLDGGVLVHDPSQNPLLLTT